MTNDRNNTAFYADLMESETPVFSTPDVVVFEVNARYVMWLTPSGNYLSTVHTLTEAVAAALAIDPARAPIAAAYNALQTVSLDSFISEWLLQNDPQALKWVRHAIGELRPYFQPAPKGKAA